MKLKTQFALSKVVGVAAPEGLGNSKLKITPSEQLTQPEMLGNELKKLSTI
ncbi:MAG: hypothetical protein F6K42_23560 [Leptolyngbya sp. SIO1D8]|nr:hypothetical protein [Leptolyngbya sp. SIO1D8]